MKYSNPTPDYESCEFLLMEDMADLILTGFDAKHPEHLYTQREVIEKEFRHLVDLFHHVITHKECDGLKFMGKWVEPRETYTPFYDNDRPKLRVRYGIHGKPMCFWHRSVGSRNTYGLEDQTTGKSLMKHTVEP